MSQMVNWELYNSLSVKKKISEDNFEQTELLAEFEVRSVIGPIRWANITEQTPHFIILQECICKVIDKMVTDAESGKGKGIASASNDGYSESYTIQTEEQLRTELHRSIKAWLSGTGLVGGY